MLDKEVLNQINGDTRRKLQHEAEIEPKLLALCKKYIDDNHISCGETIFQCDRVAESSLEFIEEICELVGYWETPDEEESDV